MRRVGLSKCRRLRRLYRLTTMLMCLESLCISVTWLLTPMWSWFLVERSCRMAKFLALRGLLNSCVLMSVSVLFLCIADELVCLFKTSPRVESSVAPLVLALLARIARFVSGINAVL